MRTSMAGMEDIRAVAHPESGGVSLRFCAKYADVVAATKFGVCVGNRMLRIEVIKPHRPGRIVHKDVPT